MILNISHNILVNVIPWYYRWQYSNNGGKNSREQSFEYNDRIMNVDNFNFGYEYLCLPNAN